MTTVAAPRRFYSRRNRPVTACSECTRRKQKCDQDFPCQKCVARGVESKCSYQPTKGIDGPGHPTKRRKINSPELTPGHTSQISSVEGPELSEQVGYSQQGTNALSALNQLLHGSPAPPSASSCASSFLHPSKCGDFWKLVEILPATGIVQELVEVFFKEANWYFAVLDQYFFDALHMKWIAFRSGAKPTDAVSLEVSSFAALLLQVVALAMQFLPPGHACEDSLSVSKQEERDELSGSLSETGEALMTLLGRRMPTVTSVQADLMRCAWLKNDGRGAEAWYSLGNAVRQAQELGLHLKTNLVIDTGDMTAETLRALWYDEHKRRLWVTLFIWESHMSLQLGRPRMINASDCTLTDPIDCDVPLEPTRTLFKVPQPNERPSSFTLQLVKYRIGRAIHRMMSMGATDPLLQDYGILQSFQDDVSEMLTSLPQAMQLENPDTSWDLMYPGLVKQRLQISIVVYSFLVALHRPHASRHVSSRQNAVEAAIRSLESSHELFQRSQPCHYKIYTLVFNTIDSGIFLAAAAIKHYTTPSVTRERSFRTLKQAVERLGVLKDRNVAARHGEKVLTKCLQKFRQAWTDQTTSQPDIVHNNGVLAGSTLADSGTNTEVSPDSAVPMDGGATVPAIEHDPLLGRDLFDEITNATASTASWLEHMDMMSRLDFRFDESDYMWDSLFR